MYLGALACDDEPGKVSGNNNGGVEMRTENKQMQEFLASKGIKAVPKYLYKGSLKVTWILYGKDQKWTELLRSQFIGLGFLDYDGESLTKYSGNGGFFHVNVRYPASRKFLEISQSV